jgi:hypothetical protein
MSTQGEEVGLGRRLRTTFGPTLAGLAGGALMGLAALVTMTPLCRNMAATYDRFPGLSRPWLASEVTLPGWLEVVFVLIGMAAPVAMGAAAVWLARPRDTWADLSAGLTTALAGTLMAFVSALGSAVVLALVVVPSISDLTLMGEAASGPAPGRPAPSLVQSYPDLEQVEPAQRGGAFMAKIVSDQVAGSITSVWLGMLLTAVVVGPLALGGTLAAGYLWRRGGSARGAVLPYLEITLPVAATLALVGWTALVSVPDNRMTSGLALAGLAGVTALMVTGVVRRWPWLLRLCLALNGLMLLCAARPGSSMWLPGLLTTALVVVLLVVRSFRGTGRAAVAAS